MTESGTTKEMIEQTFYMNNGQVLTETISKEKEERIFKGILSGEVVDKEGDLIPIEEFAKFFKTLIRRQTPILLKHQPIHVGNLLALEKTIYNGIPAVLVKARILNDFPKDHETWEGIIKGKYFGMSFTGDVEQTIIKCDDNKCHKERKLSAIYEITITDRPANQVSKILNYLTKEYKKEEENMTEEGKEKANALSKETLQEEFKNLGESLGKSLGEGLNSSIKAGFETLAKSLVKEEKPKDKPEAEEEEDGKDPKETKEVKKELDWATAKELFAKEIELETDAKIKAKTSSVETPEGSSPNIIKETKKPLEYTGALPTKDELLAHFLG